MDGLGVDLIVGMDAIHAYGIDAIISHSMALITVNKHEMAFPIEFRRSKGVRDHALSDSFPVLCDKNIIIPPFHEAPVSVLLGYKTRGDLWLHAARVPNDTGLWFPLDGGWIAEGPLNPDSRHPTVLFANMSNRFLRLRRGPVIGQMTLCGTHDFLGTTDIQHEMIPRPNAPPQIVSCVPNKAASSDLWTLLVHPSLHHESPSPAAMMDPHNRDPPPEPSGFARRKDTSSPFDISDAYGSGSPRCAY